MTRALLLMPLLLVCGCAINAPAQYSSPAPMITYVPLPPAYIACLQKEAVNYATESQLGTACRPDLEAGMPPGLGYVQQASTIYRLEIDAKPLREKLIAETAQDRLATERAKQEKEDAAMKEDTRRWGDCAFSVITQKTAGMPVLDAVRIAKLACGQLWKGARDEDDAFYYQIVVGVRAPSNNPTVVTTKPHEKPDIRM